MIVSRIFVKSEGSEGRELQGNKAGGTLSVLFFCVFFSMYDLMLKHSFKLKEE